MTAGGAGDLSSRDWFAVAVRAGKGMLEDNMMMIASALAYSTFFAIPSVLLAVVGLFTLLAGPGTIDTLIQHLGQVMPAQATQLLRGSLVRLEQKPSAGLTLTIVGFVLAFWSMTGAMTSYMTALNLAYEQKDRRPFIKKRITALAMVACIGAAFLLVAGLLIFGPPIEKYLGRAIGAQSILTYVWWAAQWPILVAGLLAAFATLLWLGPDVEHRRWRFLTVGSAIAVAIWLLASGAIRVLHRPVRLLQQNLGLARCGDHHAHLALVDVTRAALRRRVQRRGGAESRTETQGAAGASFRSPRVRMTANQARTEVRPRTASTDRRVVRLASASVWSHGTLGIAGRWW